MPIVFQALRAQLDLLVNAALGLSAKVVREFIDNELGPLVGAAGSAVPSAGLLAALEAEQGGSRIRT